MDPSSLFGEFFVAPIIERSGYNLVNTLAYALIALGSLFLIWKLFERERINIGKSFWAGAIAFTLFGSSLRVVVDSVDNGAMALALGASFDGGVLGIFGWIAAILYPIILDSGIFAYSYLTVSPGIYIASAILFLAAIFIERGLGIRYWACAAGLLLAGSCIVALLPMMKYFEYGAFVVLAAGAATAALALALKLDKIEFILPIFGHALDGAATWVAVDIFGPAHSIAYFEQHVLPSAIGEGTPLGYGLFFAIKAVFAGVAVSIIRKEGDRRLVLLALLVVLIIGLAPGLRDLLRMVAGT